MIGPTILQGPHQTAQESTNTGLSDFKTACSKVASVISNAIILFLISYKSRILFSIFNPYSASFRYIDIGKTNSSRNLSDSIHHSPDFLCNALNEPIIICNSG